MRAVLVLLAALLVVPTPAGAGGPPVDERLVQLRSERTALQARAGAARVALLMPLRVAGLLTDALAARAGSNGATLDMLPAPSRQAFVALDDLNDALNEALLRPGEAAEALVGDSTTRATQALEAMAVDDRPLLLQVTPRVVAPRRGSGELAIVPHPPRLPPAAPDWPPSTAAARVDPGAPVVRYRPDVVPAADEDPPVRIEIAGRRLAGDPPATLTVGDWRGEAEQAPERLSFSVPRRAFAGDSTRASLSTGLLALRRDGRLLVFELPFLVLPDQAGSVALDQTLRWRALESTTLMSPEIVVRAPAGETRAVRRCFNPPPGWRFDKQQHREVIVERLGWLDDTSDPALNGGTVEFAGDEGPGQICLAVTASSATKGARTATIGRFEATLTRDQSHDKLVQSGVRALDWDEPIRLPIETEAVERKLHVRLFGEIDRELAEPLASLPFLRISREGNVLVLRADPSDPWN